MTEVRFPYKPNAMIFFLAIGFFGVCAGILGAVAISNDKGLVINRLIEMSPESATNFYWVITVLSVALVLLGLAGLVKSISSNREIVLTENSITAPKNLFSKTDVSIEFANITGIDVQTIQKTKLLNISHLNGKLSIPNNMLPDKEAFENLVSQFTSRVNS